MQDDFEESLVRQVIKENPPEEQGKRPEWQEHAGWHRKEYIHLRGAEPIQQVGKNHANPEEGVGVMDNKQLAAYDIISSNCAIYITVVAALLFVLLFIRIKRSRHKTRKQ